MTINSKLTLLHRINQPEPGVVIDIQTDEYRPVSHWVYFGATRDGISGPRPRPQMVQDDIQSIEIDALLHRFNQPCAVILKKFSDDNEHTPVSHWVHFGATRDGMSGVRPQLAEDKPQSVTEGKSDD